MSAVGRFLVGLLIGVALPLGGALTWTKLTGNDPVIVVHGEVGDEQETILRSRVEGLMDELGIGLASIEVKTDLERMKWVENAEVWRTLTNRLHIEITSATNEDAIKDSDERSMDPGSRASTTFAKTQQEFDELTIKNLSRQANEVGDVLENALRTSEGLKIVLESGTSVLLGNQDLEGRMDRFLAVYREIEGEYDVSRLVADARYDQGVAVVVPDEDEDSSFSNDDEITSSPMVITHE